MTAAVALEGRMPVDELADLVAAARAGDRAALEALLVNIERRVFALAYRLVGEPAAAEDVAQEALLRYDRYAQRDSAVLRGLESDPLRLELAGNLMCRMTFRVRDTIELDLLIQGPLQTINDRTFNPELLATTTTVKSGETVVLGASKMQGGSSALIVLLTAKLLP
ncbi:MAG: hypothetical protein HY238_01985 [Acidobacteria bacterium]|nr:hypothetical protein [Acidobacteriota bacterium]